MAFGSGDIAIVLSESVDGFGIIAATVVENNHTVRDNAFNGSPEGLFFAASFVGKAQQNTAQGKAITGNAPVFCPLIDQKRNRKNIIAGKEFRLILIALLVMWILAKATCGLFLALGRRMSHISNDASLRKDPEQKAQERGNEIFDLP